VLLAKGYWGDQIRENVMGRAHGVHGREKNLHRIWFKYLEERDCLENQGVGRMILKN
jgi:phage gp46-like protein